MKFGIGFGQYHRKSREKVARKKKPNPTIIVVVRTCASSMLML